MSFRRVLLFAVLAVLPAAMVGCAGRAVLDLSRASRSFKKPNDSDVVATVDGEPVARGEFELVMGRKVALTHVYFKTRYDVDDHDGFWEGSFGGESPLARLKAEALRECVGIKARQMLARRMGIVSAIDYASFRESLARENSRRERALRNGGPVYGPRELSEGQYQSYLLSNMALRLNEMMARGDGTPKSGQLALGSAPAGGSAGARPTVGAPEAGTPATMGDRDPVDEPVDPDAACRELTEALAAKATVRINKPVWDSLYPTPSGLGARGRACR